MFPVLRVLHENITNRWCAHRAQYSHAYPCSGCPHATNPASSRSTCRGRSSPAAVNVARTPGRLLRADLYYRLGVAVAELPPLRERPEDLPLLVDEILERLRLRHGLQHLSSAAREEAARWPWPGNVRELENTLERVALLADEGVIRTLRLPNAVPLGDRGATRKGGAVSRAEFERAMAEAAGDPGEAARILGVQRRSVLRLAARYGAGGEES